tara:strand:- start:1734 stop:2588 length:855 start_codon:yes stop_codon:yes gene_type:complete
MDKKLLLLGSTGKMGIAIKSVFEKDYSVIGKNTSDFDAQNFKQVRSLIEKINPDIVINTVAFLGIDPCEIEPEKALRLNTLYPKLIAEISNKMNFLFIHFSTDAVFNDVKGNYYVESDCPSPLNVYGFSKYGGDCFIKSLAKKYYIFRVSVLFGEALKKNQFVEKMLHKIEEGQKNLKISDDIISSPTYTIDVADEVKKILETEMPYGLYHIANEGKISLYQLMEEVTNNLGVSVKVEKASYNDFSYIGIKNTYTPLLSEKIKPLRPWQDAVKEYCNNIKIKGQ